MAHKKSDHQKVVDYFSKKEGWLSKSITDEEYYRTIVVRCDSDKLRSDALKTVGLNEDDTDYYPPAVLEGYVYDSNMAKKSNNGKLVSATYQVSWIFITCQALYLCCYMFDMYEDKVLKNSYKFHWKDIISISITPQSEVAHGLGDMRFEIQTDMLKLKAVDNEVLVPVNSTGNYAEIVQALKMILRGWSQRKI